MSTAEIVEMNGKQTPPRLAYSELRLPAGLLGFERFKDYLLVARAEEAPFRRLEVKDNASLMFIVIEPAFVLPDYRPDIPASDAEFLELLSPEEALVYNIVTLQGPGRATVNLKGPIVINRRTNVAKQVVLANAAEYSVEHPLPVTEPA